MGGETNIIRNSYTGHPGGLYYTLLRWSKEQYHGQCTIEISIVRKA